MILKIYNIQEILPNDYNMGQLHNEINDSGSIHNFTGLTSKDTELWVGGELVLNDTELSEVISNHIPDFTTIDINKSIQDKKNFASKLVKDIKQRNILEGLDTIDQTAWIHARFRKTEFTLSDESTIVEIDVLNLMYSGDIETADAVLEQMTPDDMSEDYHWLTAVRIIWIRNQIRDYLGRPLL